VSRDLLDRARTAAAFEPTPPRQQLATKHVPFDTLCGRKETEQALYRAVWSGGRVVIMGGSGSGKSSMLAWAFRDEVDGLAPMRVPVAVEDPRVVSQPGEFAAHLVRTVERQAKLLSKREAKQLQASTRQETRTLGVTLGPPAWLVTGGISAEIETVAAREPRSATEHIERARNVMEMISAKGLQPVLVVDDADQWVNGGAEDDLVRGFFSRVIRAMCESLPAAIVVAADARYVNLRGYQAAQNVLGTRIDIPRIPLPGGVAKILEHRIRLATGGQLADVIEQGAIEAMSNVYEKHDGSLRFTMLVAQSALGAACEASAEAITERQINAAAALWSDNRIA
jgi:hypothetical protein